MNDRIIFLAVSRVVSLTPPCVVSDVINKSDAHSLSLFCYILPIEHPEDHPRSFGM